MIGQRLKKPKKLQLRLEKLQDLAFSFFLESCSCAWSREMRTETWRKRSFVWLAVRNPLSAYLKWSCQCLHADKHSLSFGLLGRSIRASTDRATYMSTRQGELHRFCASRTRWSCQRGLKTLSQWQNVSVLRLRQIQYFRRKQVHIVHVIITASFI